MAFNIPPELVVYFKEKQASLIIGAGFSLGAGLPDWEKLLKQLILKYSQLPYALPEKISDYNELVKDKSKFLVLAEDLKESISPKGYIELLEEIFGKGDISPTQNHHLVIDLKPSFIITLNYDRLIENAYTKIEGFFPSVYTYKQSREAANAFWKNKFYIFKAHGDAFTDASNLILTQKDYEQILFRENGYRSILQTMFTSKSMLLLGLSLNDPELNLLLDYLHDSYHGGGPIHYILLEKGQTSNTLMERLFVDFNIQTITFDNTDGSFNEITDFLSELNRLIKL